MVQLDGTRTALLEVVGSECDQRKIDRGGLSGGGRSARHAKPQKHAVRVPLRPIMCVSSYRRFGAA
jgi:hypothetical protein